MKSKRVMARTSTVPDPERGACPHPDSEISNAFVSSPFSFAPSIPSPQNIQPQTKNPLSLSLGHFFSVIFCSFHSLSGMNTHMATPSQDFSKRNSHSSKLLGNEDADDEAPPPTSQSISQLLHNHHQKPPAPATGRKLQALAVSRLRSVLAAFHKNRSNPPFALGPRIVGTLFGNRRGHVHLAFQKDPTSRPAFLIELATPISGLVREMASGLVRITLECDKSKEVEKKPLRLLEEPVWKTYCNGKKCGFASKRDCGDREWEILKAVEPISMGAGVLPGGKNEAESESDGELMYMRAKFERVVGSRDSEAFYMMNPDCNGVPELSVYLLRV